MTRKQIATIAEITTAHMDFPFSYVLKLSNGYHLSILTGSHFNSSELGTLEIALMENGYFAFGEDDSDESIIHYIKPERATAMVEQMLAADSSEYKNIFNTFFDDQYTEE